MQLRGCWSAWLNHGLLPAPHNLSCPKIKKKFKNSGPFMGVTGLLGRVGTQTGALQTPTATVHKCPPCLCWSLQEPPASFSSSSCSLPSPKSPQRIILRHHHQAFPNHLQPSHILDPQWRKWCGYHGLLQSQITLSSLFFLGSPHVPSPHQLASLRA